MGIDISVLGHARARAVGFMSASTMEKYSLSG